MSKYYYEVKHDFEKKWNRLSVTTKLPMFLDEAQEYINSYARYHNINSCEVVFRCVDEHTGDVIFATDDL